ncbi:hypothetical protein PL373_13610 [Tenacibaculum maritimum]|nr:hypothetical protein [Tenacibaculum maritimum]MDB0602166.1 hypothetical protein [Tenacibaculum maritimum]MDB0613842.1 hypothetical protein [Tenacibaculum maritimum]
MMVVDNKYRIGEVVFLLTDEDQLKRVVTAITVRSGGYITYELSQGIDTSWHIESEISNSKVYH